MLRKIAPQINFFNTLRSSQGLFRTFSNSKPPLKIKKLTSEEQAIYDQGFKKGLETGDKIGYHRGLLEKGFKEGYKRGYGVGHRDGFKQGADEVKAAAEQDGYINGLLAASKHRFS